MESKIDDIIRKVNIYIKSIKKISSHYEAFKKVMQDLFDNETSFSKDFTLCIESFEASSSTPVSIPSMQFTFNIINSIHSIHLINIQSVSNMGNMKSTDELTNVKSDLANSKQKLETEGMEIEKEFVAAKKIYEQKSTQLNADCDILQKNLIDPYDCKARESLGNKIISTHNKMPEFQTRYKAAIENRNTFFKNINENLQKCLTSFEVHALDIFKEVFNMIFSYSSYQMDLSSHVKNIKEIMENHHSKAIKQQILLPKLNSLLLEITLLGEVKLKETEAAKESVSESLVILGDLKNITDSVLSLYNNINGYIKSLKIYISTIANIDSNNIKKLDNLVKRLPSYFQGFIPSYCKQWCWMFEFLLTRNIEIKTLVMKNITANSFDASKSYSDSQALTQILTVLQELYNTLFQIHTKHNDTVNAISFELQLVESSTSNKEELSKHQEKLIQLRESQEEIKSNASTTIGSIYPKLREIIVVLNKHIECFLALNTKYVEYIFNKCSNTNIDANNYNLQFLGKLSEIISTTKEIKYDVILKEIILHYSNNTQNGILEIKGNEKEEEPLENKNARNSILTSPNLNSVMYTENTNSHEDIITSLKSKQTTSNKRDWFSKKFMCLEEEQVIQNYSCALQLKIALQGRLYITNKRICFHSYFTGSIKLIGETKISIPLEDIISLAKKKNILIFDNSLELQLKTKSYMFISFFNRNDAYKCIETTIRKFKEKPSLFNNDHKPDMAIPHSPSKLEDSPFKCFMECIDKIERERRELYKAKDIKVPDSSFGHLLLEEVFDCPIQAVSIEFMNPTKCGRFCMKVFNDISGDKNYQIKCTDSTPPEYFLSYKCAINNIYKRYIQNNSFSEINNFSNWVLKTKSIGTTDHKISTNVPFLPKSAPIEQNIEYYWISPNYFVAEIKATSKNVPRGDFFYSWNYLSASQIITMTDKGLQYKTKVVSRFKIVFVKDTLLKGAIEATGLKECGKLMGKDFPTKFAEYISEEKPRIEKLMCNEEDKIIRCRYEFPTIDQDLIAKCKADAKPFIYMHNQLMQAIKYAIWLNILVLLYVMLK